MGEKDRYYPQLEIPDRFKVTTGPEESAYIEQRKDQFFRDVLDALGLDQKAREQYASEEAYELALPFQEKSSASHLQLTDRRINLLFVMHQMIASVVANRDDFNYWEVGFASYLNPNLEFQIKEAHERDNKFEY